MKKSENGKPKRKKWPIILAVVLILGAISYLGGNSVDQKGNSDQPPNTSTPDNSTPPDTPAPTAVNPLMETELHIADVMNGFGTEEIGEWGYIEISKTDMATVTGEQLTEFCQNKCDGSGLNWVGIVLDDGSGLHVTPGAWFVQIDYGMIDIKTATFSDKVGAVMPETWADDTPITSTIVPLDNRPASSVPPVARSRNIPPRFFSFRILSSVMAYRFRAFFPIVRFISLAVAFSADANTLGAFN